MFRQVEDDSVKDLMNRGDELYNAMYGTTADGVQTLLDTIHPDMGAFSFLHTPHHQIDTNPFHQRLGFFSKTIGYGLVYNHPSILNQLHTSYSIVSALVAMDTPRQVGWHLANCRRGGASGEEVRAVRKVAMEVAGACGVNWKEGLPEVEDD
jgi:hypothetical protein